MLLLALFSCTTNVYNTYPTTENTYEITESTVSGSTSDDEDLDAGAPDTTVNNDALAVNVFGADGNRYWLSVTSEELASMNEIWSNSWAYDSYFYSISSSDTSANDLVVVDAETNSAASFGKVQLSVVGQSTGTTWDSHTIPNLSIDMDEFQEGLTVNGTEHLRFNNGQVSSIFREAIALEVFRQWGYPAPRTSFAWLSSNIWGEGITVPYTLVERYKDDWCAANADLIGGGCANVWEGFGDFSADYGWGYSIADQCDGKTCDNTRMHAFIDLLDNTESGAGFKEATAEYIDWPMVQQHMCANWILWIGDDPYHNMNNVVIVEGLDGKFRPLPYSTDISAGQSWYRDTSLYGINQLATNCAFDEQCWSETVTACETMIGQFQAIDPTGIVNDVYDRLEAQGMLRNGDDQTYAEIAEWYTNRSTIGVLETELENYRSPWSADCIPDTGGWWYYGGGSNPCPTYDTGVIVDSAIRPDTAGPHETGM